MHKIVQKMQNQNQKKSRTIWSRIQVQMSNQHMKKSNPIAPSEVMKTAISCASQWLDNWKDNIIVDM